MFAKYFAIYRLSFATQLTYRLNFFLGRVRNIIILLVLYTLYTTLTKNTSFAGYSQEQFITYLFLLHVLRNFIFGSQSRLPASEINDGTFSTYLMKPLKHPFYTYMRELAERLTLVLTSLVELFVLWLILQTKLLWQSDFTLLFCFFISVILAHFLYVIFSYLVSMIAFWSREAMGPRFLFEWMLEMMSGAYFPLSILPIAVGTLLHFLPFMYMLYVPIQIYLGKIPAENIFSSLLIQCTWILLLGMITGVVWKKGLKKYSSEGI